MRFIKFLTVRSLKAGAVPKRTGPERGSVRRTSRSTAERKAAMVLRTVSARLCLRCPCGWGVAHSRAPVEISWGECQPRCRGSCCAGRAAGRQAARILQAQLDRLVESKLADMSRAKPLDSESARGRKRIGPSIVASPSPRPSPPGRGRIVRRAFANPERLDFSQRGMRCSLSLRERARVRGNEAPPTKTRSASLFSSFSAKLPTVG